MNKNRWPVLLLILSAGYTAPAQENSKYLSLQQAVAASMANNKAIRLAAFDVQIAHSKLRQADAAFLPQADFSYSAATTNDPLNAFGFKLQQGTIKESDFSPKQLNSPNPTPDFSARIEVIQPLLNADKLYQRKSAAVQMEMYQDISDRAKEYISFETEKAYLHLQLSYNEQSVLKESLKTSQAFYKLAGDYYAQGLVQKSDLLNADVQVVNMETQVKRAASAIRDASDALAILMGEPAGTTYTTDSAHIAGNRETGNEEVNNERLDFMALEKAMKSYELLIQSSKLNFLPKLNAVASYQRHDKTAPGFGTSAYFTGIQLSWSLFNGNRTKHIVSQQLLEKEKLATQLDQQKREAQAQIYRVTRQMNDASFGMDQQQLAIEQASDALRVVQNRFVQGLVKTTDVLMAQTQLAQQKIGYARALFEYNLAAASLLFLTTGK